MSKIRSRFAPSPTGFMHVGGIRTAIFAWAMVKKHGGQFILRIEDTDKQREVEGAVGHIIESLEWLGIDWQEGPVKGGDFGPYLQSERLDIYRKWAQKLIDSGRAYADPFSQEELNKLRDQAKQESKPFLFRYHRPESTSTPEDWYEKSTIRFKSNPRSISWIDEVRGELSAGEEAMDDFVLIKADGFPTYNFAHVIDDFLMEITHVVRGEEFISSMPKFIDLHDALKIDMPKFVTVPPILNQQGGKKLSKRDGAKDVLEYRDGGLLPVAVMNFLTSLGFNDGTEREVYTVEEFLKSFSLDRIQKSGAKFDETKLEWLNWQHIVAKLKSTDYQQALQDLSIAESLNRTEIDLALSKSNNLDTLKQQTAIFTSPGKFSISDNSDLAQVDKKLSKDMAEEYLKNTIELLQKNSFAEDALEEDLRDLMDQLGAKPRHFLNLLRWAVSGQRVSPSLFALMSVLGKEETLERLHSALD